ncbi:hypothetical protein Aperf_G00000004329 [Anoplocephala perfoliata]
MLKPQASNTESGESNSEHHRFPASNFFVSFWARVKFLFTTALAEVCNCSVASKKELSHGDSFSNKGDEDCSEDTSHQAIESPPDALHADQEPTRIPLLDAIAEGGSSDLREERNDISAQSHEVAVITLLRESSHNLDKPQDSLDNYETILEEHLEPIDLTDEGQFSTAIVLAHPTMMASVAPPTYFSKLLQVAEKKEIFEVLPTGDEEVIFEENFPAEHICSSSEVSSDNECFQPLTTLGRLQTKLMNGELTNEKYQEMAACVIASTIPRNLSDSDETRKTRGANQLYAWQIPPPLPGLHSDEDLMGSTVQQVGIDEYDSGAFVECLISNAVEKIARDDRSNGSGDSDSPQKTDQVDGAKPGSFHPFPLDIPNLYDPYDEELQTASLDRVRSVSYAGVVRSKRSSSLKSERSPDDVPCRKIVRFADSLGLDLATVRQVKDADNPPNIPASATLDLNLDTEKSFSSLGAKQYQLCFPQPGSSANFMHRVLTSFVCLENARVESSRGLLTGTIRVKSVGYEKQVAVRITYNNWSTFFEIPASYVQDSHDGITDRFSFSAVFPSTMVANDRVQFAVRYETHKGTTYWDNNHGENYVITCYAKATDMAGDGSWIHYL